MAPYMQSPDAPNTFTGHDSMGRGGRGKGKKGRGGHTGNSGNIHRAPSYGNNYSNYGPHVVPDMHTAHLSSPWGMQYGGYPMPEANMAIAPGPWMPPNSHFDHTAAMMQPQISSSGYAMPSEVGSFDTLVQVPPIASPAPRIAIPTDQDMAPKTQRGISKKDGRVAATLQKVPIKTSTTADSTEGDTPAVATPITSKHALASKHITSPAQSKTGWVDVVPLPPTIEKHFVSSEGQTFPLDAPHKNPGDTDQVLDHEALMQLQVFNITLAAMGQQSLLRAKTTYAAGEEAQQKRRAIVLSLIQAARESELTHEKNVCRLMDRYHHKMREACKLFDTDAKSAAQLQAIRYSELSREESYLATEYRLRIERFRNDLHDLDNARILSTLAYADAVHDVVKRALGGKPDPTESAVPTKSNRIPLKDAELTETSPSIPLTAQANRSAPLPKQAHQPVFERHAKPEHQSIDEVLDLMKTTAETDGFKKWDDASGKIQVKADTENAENHARPSYAKVVVASDVVEVDALDKKDSVVEPARKKECVAIEAVELEKKKIAVSIEKNEVKAENKNPEGAPQPAKRRKAWGKNKKKGNGAATATATEVCKGG